MPPNLTGYYCFVSQKNMEDYLQALSNGLTPPRPLSLPLFPSTFLPLHPIEKGECWGWTLWKGSGAGTSLGIHV